MNYYLDCEFIEDGNTIDLISIGIVSEVGEEFYRVNSCCAFNTADDWVWKNVLYPMGIYSAFQDLSTVDEEYGSSAELVKVARRHDEIKDDLLKFIGKDKNPEFWGEWCSYDWVALCQLFGKMIDLPPHFPMRCRDVIQYCDDHLKMYIEALPDSLETKGNHNALLGAYTVKARYEWCLARELERTN